MNERIAKFSKTFVMTFVQITTNKYVFYYTFKVHKYLEKAQINCKIPLQRG